MRPKQNVAVNSWTAPGAGFDFVSPLVSTTAAAVDGNVAGLVAGLGGAIPTPWNSGQTLGIRWSERNDDGNDHGLAIAIFSVTAVPAPEPSTQLSGRLPVLPLGAERSAVFGVARQPDHAPAIPAGESAAPPRAKVIVRPANSAQHRDCTAPGPNHECRMSQL